MDDHHTSEPLDHAPSQRILPFEFRGDGFEYFKIWIVNLLLTIVTIGIYSAWAKVRNHRYFYSNLYLEGHSFRYLASPWVILRGRIIAVVALIIFSFVSQTFPLIGLGMTVLLLIAIPYIVNSSLAFTQRNSSYKNIQFRFHGNYLGAVMVLYVWPLLGMVTLGLCYPLALKKSYEYIVSNSSYGETHFEFHASTWEYAKVFLVILAVVIFMGVSFVVLGPELSSLQEGEIPSLGVALTLIIISSYAFLFIYPQVAFLNIYYQNCAIAEHDFTSDISMIGFAKVLFINALLTILTLGLYLPAAKVRMTKYLADHVQIEATGDLDNFVAAEKQEGNALGEELGQVFDLGI